MPRYSAAMVGGHGGLRRGAVIETTSPELQKIFGSNRWKIMDTGGGLRRWQIDCYFGEDEPLGPGSSRVVHVRLPLIRIRQRANRRVT